ncbi:MAG: hypothetical protein IPK10_10245 [Bacteroidetes bacterium]|nr:hypothetical protein [Bacteroidota bacterium]
MAPPISTAWKKLSHVVNHSTYHRGQLITLLRTVGFTTVESTDFIRYLRMQEKSA